MQEAGGGWVTWKECSWPFLHFTCWEKELNLKKKCCWKVLGCLVLSIFRSLPQSSFAQSQSYFFRAVIRQLVYSASACFPQCCGWKLTHLWQYFSNCVNELNVRRYAVGFLLWIVHRSLHYTSLLKWPVSCFYTLINKQARAKLRSLHPQVCVIQSDSCRCLATGCGKDTLECLSINPEGLPVAYAWPQNAGDYGAHTLLSCCRENVNVNCFSCFLL